MENVPRICRLNSRTVKTLELRGKKSLVNCIALNAQRPTPNDPEFEVTAAAAGTVQFNFINVPVAPYIWTTT